MSPAICLWCRSEKQPRLFEVLSICTKGRVRGCTSSPLDLLIKLKSKLVSRTWTMFDMFLLNFPAPICFRQATETNRRLRNLEFVHLDWNASFFFTFWKSELENIPRTLCFVPYQSLVSNYWRCYLQGWDLSLIQSSSACAVFPLCEISL